MQIGRPSRRLIPVFHKNVPTILSIFCAQVRTFWSNRRFHFLSPSSKFKEVAISSSSIGSSSLFSLQLQAVVHRFYLTSINYYIYEGAQAASHNIILYYSVSVGTKGREHDWKKGRTSTKSDGRAGRRHKRMDSSGVMPSRGRQIAKFLKMTLCYSCVFGRKAPKSTGIFIIFNAILYFCQFWQFSAMFSNFCGLRAPWAARAAQVAGGGTSSRYATADMYIIHDYKVIMWA